MSKMMMLRSSSCLFSLTTRRFQTHQGRELVVKAAMSSHCNILSAWQSRRFPDTSSTVPLASTTTSSRTTTRGLSSYENTTGSNSDSNNANTTSYSLTGTVKFYRRNKSYGFLIPDGTDAEIFVHWSGIVAPWREGLDPPPPPPPPPSPQKNPNQEEEEASVSEDGTDDTYNNNEEDGVLNVERIQRFYPFLRKGERVRFRIQQDETTGAYRALDVTWLNGEVIPPLRQNFLGSVHDRIRENLGQACFQMIHQEIQQQEKAATSEAQGESNEKLLESIFAQARFDLQRAHALIQAVGMNVESFPVVKTKDNRFYQYEKTKQQQSSSSPQEPEETPSAVPEDAERRGVDTEDGGQRHPSTA